MSVASDKSVAEKQDALTITDDKQQPKSKKYARRYGSRYEVFDAETAKQTRGGLTKADLMLSRTGKIVSRKKSLAAKALYTQYGFNKRPKPEEAKPKKKKTPPKRRRKKKSS